MKKGFGKEDASLRDFRSYPWFRVHRDFVTSFQVHFLPAGAAVYNTLCSYAEKETEEARVSVYKIAQLNGLSEITVRRYLYGFARHRLIVIQREDRDIFRKHWPMNSYWMRDVSDWVFEKVPGCLFCRQGPPAPKKVKKDRLQTELNLMEKRSGPVYHPRYTGLEGALAEKQDEQYGSGQIDGKVTVNNHSDPFITGDKRGGVDKDHKKVGFEAVSSTVNDQKEPILQDPFITGDKRVPAHQTRISNPHITGDMQLLKNNVQETTPRGGVSFLASKGPQTAEGRFRGVQEMCLVQLVYNYKVLEVQADNADWDKEHLEEYLELAVELVARFKGDVGLAQECIRELVLDFKQRGLNYTFHTVMKKQPKWAEDRAKEAARRSREEQRETEVKQTETAENERTEKSRDEHDRMVAQIEMLPADQRERIRELAAERLAANTNKLYAGSKLGLELEMIQVYVELRSRSGADPGFTK